MDLLAQDWRIEFHSGIPAYRQIINRIQAEISRGNLREGDQLPTIRALHQKLQVNPNTVARAYRELALTGVIESQQGSGSFVARPRDHAALPTEVRQAKTEELAARLTAEARSHGIQIEDLIKRLTEGKAHA